MTRSPFVVRTNVPMLRGDLDAASATRRGIAGTWRGPRRISWTPPPPATP